MTYVLSDIHGQYDKFMSMIDKINLQDSDTLYILGDIIDRGPKNLEMIYYVMSHSNIKMILGNHEDMMLNYYSDKSFYNKVQWYRNGGYTTDKQFKSTRKVNKEKILNFFNSLPIEYKITVNKRDFWLVHGSYSYSLNKAEYKDEIIWGRLSPYDKGPKDNITVIFGHTPTSHYLPTVSPCKIWKNDRIIGIDCGLAAMNFYPEEVQLGCLKLDDLSEYYV